MPTPDRRSSTGSRSATPTIWETYKILGQQYTKLGPESKQHIYQRLIKTKFFQEEKIAWIH